MFFFDYTLKSSSRFDLARFIGMSENVFDLNNSYFVQNLQTLPVAGYFEVNDVTATKPWLISYRIYNSVEYWWTLMLYNNVIDFMKLTSGLQLKYPSMQSMEGLFYSLRKAEITYNREALT